MNFKKIFAFTLAAVLLISSLCVSAIKEEPIRPNWTYIKNVSGQLTYDSSAKAGEWSIDVKGNTSVVKITADITVFHKQGNTWYEVDTWSRSTSSNSLTAYDNFDAEEGESYKLVISAKAYTSSKTETASKTITKTF